MTPQFHIKSWIHDSGSVLIIAQWRSVFLAFPSPHEGCHLSLALEPQRNPTEQWRPRASLEVDGFSNHSIQSGRGFFSTLTCTDYRMSFPITHIFPHLQNYNSEFGDVMWVSIANAWVLKGFLYAHRVLLKAARVLMAMVWIGICQSPLSSGGKRGKRSTCHWRCSYWG